MIQASEFEFRHRSLLNLIHFWISFQVYSFDKTNVVWWLVSWDTPQGARRARILFAVAALLLLMAASVRTWAAAYLSSSVVHDTKLHTEALVADGPYRHVRNPLYLGTFLMTVGLGFLASRVGFAFLVVGAAIRILRLVGREESELQRQRGEPFREYCRRVPRFLPSLAPRLPAGGRSPQWGQAFAGEAIMWGFFITMSAFTITLRDRVAWTLAGASLLIWLGQTVARRARGQGAT